MASQRANRRLAAILAADVAGYSGLVERDEARTLARLGALRTDVIEPALAEHRGRLVKLIGDGVLAEFGSVVDAVACAIDIHQRNADGLPLRIGVNLGDVVADGDDIYGDGVNVAARLEGIAEVGGVVVSGTAWDQLHGKLGLSFESLGERRLKNIERPVRAYRLVGRTGPPVTTEAAPPDRPSIAVLPFDNMSGDPAQAYFSDGITEDLITELSRFRELVVIERNSSFAFRGQTLDAIEIGRRLGVRYLLEGSVRKAGERVRITAQLIDATTGGHLWADHYDRAQADIFAVQDEVVARIATTLAVRIQAAGLARAKRKPTTDLAAYDCVLRGMEQFAGYGPDANAAARELFERAVALDPDYAVAHAYLSLSIFAEDWGDAPASQLARCLAHAHRAVALDDADSRCHRALAMPLLNAHEFEQADFHSERAVALNPSDAHAAANRAYVLCFLGRPDEAIMWVRRAIDLNPFHPAWYWRVFARALHDAGYHAEAIAAFERILARRFHHEARLAACHAQLGHMDAARHSVARVLAEKPDFSSSGWAASWPYRHEGDRQRLLAELLAAGLPP
jgi:adenylate cyclase